MLFWSYRAIVSGQSNLFAQVFWNIVLFIPIGILLMMLLKCKHKLFFSVAASLYLSSTIELIQLITHRGLFEFDDIIHNTLGAFIGAVIYVFISSIININNKCSNY